MLSNVTKGRPYSCTLPDGKVFTGTAASSASSPIARVGVYGADARGYKVPVRSLRDASPAEAAALAGALQEKLAALPQLAKGDTVEFTDDKGAVHRGIVNTCRGIRTTVDEGYTRWTMNTKNLRPVKVEPGAAGDLEGYEVAGYKHAAWNSEETMCFNATITLRGVPVAVVHNEGHGGPTSVSPVRGAPDAARRFEDLCNAAAVAAGMSNKYSENAESFVRWFRDERKLGRSLHDHFAATVAKFAEWDRQEAERKAAHKAKPETV